MLALGAVDVPWWAMTSNDDREFSVRLSAEALRAHPVEAEVLLRLGSIANALIAMGRRFPDLPYSTRKDERDAFQLMMVVAGHVWTAINELQKLHGEMWWTLAEKGVHHRDMPAYMSLPRLREVLDRDSTFAQACKRIRNKYAFHNDPAPYVSFVESARGEIRLIELKGERRLGTCCSRHRNTPSWQLYLR